MKFYKGKSALLTLLAVGLVTLFSVGCGNSDNFVFTGNTNVNPNTSGNLLFNIVEAAAQTTDEVPNGTVSLRFDFWNSTTPTGAANLVFTETRAFTGPNQEYLFENVPNTVVFVTVTAFDGSGQPLLILSGPATVVVGATTPVDLTGATIPTFNALTLSPDPVLLTFANNPGDSPASTQQMSVSGNFTVTPVLSQTLSQDYDVTIPPEDCTFTMANTGVANVTTGGLVSIVSERANTTLTCEYTAFGTTLSDQVTVRTFLFTANPGDFGTFISPFAPGASYTGGFVDHQFYDSDGTPFINVTADVTYRLLETEPTITVDPNTGNFQTTASTPAGNYHILIDYLFDTPQKPSGAGGTNTVFTISNQFSVSN